MRNQKGERRKGWRGARIDCVSTPQGSCTLYSVLCTLKTSLAYKSIEILGYRNPNDNFYY